MTRELVVDSSFAHYRIEGLIGRGGMGVVYRSTDLRLERTVAMKLIAPELAEDERFRFGSRFLRESRVAASLDDPGWSRSTTQASTTASSSSACVVEGQDLKVLLAGEGRLAPERALAILGHVARALDAVQQKGLVHPDVKGAGSGGRVHRRLPVGRLSLRPLRRHHSGPRDDLPRGGKGETSGDVFSQFEGAVGDCVIDVPEHILR